MAAVLGVTTDCLLGVGGDEKTDREKLYKEIEAIYDNDEYSYDDQENNPDYICYKLYREYIKKYPLDYEAKYRCANCIYGFLYDARRYSFSLEDSLYNEAVSLLTTLINYDRDTTRVLDAKGLLVKLYMHRKDFVRAEEIAEGLPEVGNIKSMAEIEIYSIKGDQDKCLEISKKMCCDAVNNYLWALWVRARRISIFGNERKQEAILAWRDLLESAKYNYKRFADVNIHSEHWWHAALNYLANEYIAISEFDTALDIVEELTDTLVEHYNQYIENGDTDSAKALRSNITERLHRCYNWCFNSSDNIIATDPRFQKCEERLLALD